jgi:hypothetical protein
MRLPSLVVATLSVSLLLATGACTAVKAGASGGAGGDTASSTTGSMASTSVGQNPMTSSGAGSFNNCQKPASVPLTVTLADGTKLPSDSAAPSSLTNLTGTLHLVGSDSYSVAGMNGDSITVQHDATDLAALGLSDGATVTLHIGFEVGQVAGAKAFSLEVELANDADALQYFAFVGDHSLQPSGGRVGVAFGNTSCVSGMGSGTGTIELLVRDLDVTIDSQAIGSFTMGKPTMQTTNGKTFFVDDRDSMEINYFPYGSPVAVIGHAVP